MGKGFSLVEILMALACSSILFLMLYQFYHVTSVTHSAMRADWYCMQSLRQASIQLNADMTQCAYLLPQDLKVATEERRFFIAGAPITSGNPGLCITRMNPPPYCALINSSSPSWVVLDTVDIDNDGHADFWAGLGMLTDDGPCLIRQTYSRGDTSIPVRCGRMPSSGARAVPAICYELKTDGLYRNNELLAEAVVFFSPEISGNDVKIDMRSRYHGNEKELTLSYYVP